MNSKCKHLHFIIVACGLFLFDCSQNGSAQGNINIDSVLCSFSTKTEKEREVYWNKSSPLVPLAYASNYRHSTDSTLSNLYNLTLFSKGLLLSYSVELSKSVVESRRVGDFTQYLKLGWRDVQAALSDKDVAIEFIDFPLDLTNSNDSTEYAALVIRKGWNAPKMIPLFEEKQLSSFSNKMTTNSSNLINRFYNNSEIYKIVWGPLEKENIIQEGDTIYFSASGLLHKLGVEYLPRIQDKDFTVHRLSSTKQLCVDSPKLSYNGAVLYGGLKYDKDDGINLAETEPEQWKVLPGSKRLLNNIKEQFAMHNLASEVYTGDSGLEKTFKMLSDRNIPLIFITTHGFFIPESEVERNPFMQSMMRAVGDNNPASPDLVMHRSGLVMSEGNAAWMGKPIPEGVEDGILTAQEVSELNLRGTGLVVLSACESGLGEVSGDGVFGLQRGFKKAGVQTLIMSLWQVSDEATCLMMSTFFQHLLNGEPKYDAFRAAQETVREKYRTPYFWAAFIMLD